MTTENPYGTDNDQGAAWTLGYQQGYDDPEVDHTPPVAAELINAFREGELAGRDDRRSEVPIGPPTADSVPTSDSDYTWFESAPDGVLIPVPSEAPAGNAIRPDAKITVSPLQSSGYYVAIYNAPPEEGSHADDLLKEIITEASITRLEHLLGDAAATQGSKLLKFGGLFISVAISVFTSSPVLKESLMLSRLNDGTAITYAVLDPQT